jgi:hypothetical protein
MQRFVTALLILLLFAPAAMSQDNPWRYGGEIKFPEAQRPNVRLYHIAVAANGTIYAISSVATDTLAHNSLWKANPSDEYFTLVHNFTQEGIATVHAVRGVATIGNDVLVSTHQRPGTDAAAIYYYPDGQRNQVQVYSTGGYGTHVFALSANDAGYVYATISAQASMRIYNFTSPGAAGYGAWVPMDPWNNTEAGGHDGCSVSALRDVTVVQGGDYTLTTTPFYTSRNATPQPRPDGCATSVTGRVTRWVGGTQTTPAAYANAAMSDAGGALNLTSYVGAGIFADRDERLWVTGPDTTRRWVKVFEVFGNFADELFELPSATHANPALRDAEGAPFRAPNDVALNATMSHAFVSDRDARLVHVFFDVTKVATEEEGGLPDGFTLRQNYPNPFNPSTRISYELEQSGSVRLAVFDVLGREVAVLFDGIQASGIHHATFDAGHLPSGPYVYRLEAFGRQQTRTLILSK